MLGILPESKGLRLQVRKHDGMGPRDVCNSRRNCRWQAGDNRFSRYQLKYSNSAGQFILRRLEELRDVCEERSPRKSGRQESSVESDDNSPPAKARLRWQVHLGDVAALARQANQRSSSTGYRRRPDCATLGDCVGWTCGYRLHQSDRAQREDVFTEDCVETRS